jgi:HD superfamily phosphohydrolase
MAHQKTYDFRCPIHGFVTVNAWERDIVDHRVFQRLRRIRQLAWTDMTYPGAVHTRFEHSLGVMHTASRMFEEIWRRRDSELSQLNFSGEAKERHRIILRLAALLHDVGHSPFSHGAEGLLPNTPGGKPFKHEVYSAELIRQLMPDVIDDHRMNKNNFNIKASEIADVIEAKATIGQALLFWRQLLDSQLDADRADYLLRDSHHTGVRYGHYDLDRLVISLTVAEDKETGGPVLAVDEGGWHTAEALIIARYMMFTQVYYHKTRTIYNHHLAEALRDLLGVEQAKDGLAEPAKFPPPTSQPDLEKYLVWDDWRVLGLLKAGGGGEHGEILRNRTHYRMVYDLPESDVGLEAELTRAAKVKAALGDLVAYEESDEPSWYKPTGEIVIAHGEDGNAKKELTPLSQKSRVVKALKPNRIWRFYVKPEKRDEADKIVRVVLS